VEDLGVDMIILKFMYCYMYVYCEDVDGIYATENRIHWRAYLKTVMNLCFL
jgi:hypothetical protein